MFADEETAVVVARGQESQQHQVGLALSLKYFVDAHVYPHKSSLALWQGKQRQRSAGPFDFG